MWISGFARTQASKPISVVLSQEELIERLVVYLEAPHARGGKAKSASAAADSKTPAKSPKPVKKTAKPSTAPSAKKTSVDEPMSALMFYAVEFRSAVLATLG